MITGIEMHLPTCRGW